MFTQWDVDRRRRNRRRRIIVYGGLALAVWGFYAWIPWQFDFIPRRLPVPNPPVNPDSARLFSPGTRVLVVTAHPDDSAFYIGGFITKLGRSGAEIHQIICTDGDKAYYGPFADQKENRRLRRQEALEEIRAWGGTDLVFFGLPDGRLHADAQLVDRLHEAMLRFKPEYLLLFDAEFPPRLSHQDHRRAGEAAERAAQNVPSLKWLMRFSTIAPNFVLDISNEWESQKRLLAIHRSQFYGDHLERVENFVESSAIEDGERIGTLYGEGFRCSRLHP